MEREEKLKLEVTDVFIAEKEITTAEDKRRNCKGKPKCHFGNPTTQGQGERRRRENRSLHQRKGR